LKQLAESGVFNIAGLTAIKSAERADLYEAFTYLSAVKSEQLFLQRLAEQKD